MNPKSYETLREQFRKVFEARWDPAELENYEDLREKFAFHMADVAKNLAAMTQVYSDAEKCDIPCVTERVEMFFNDCVPHLMAAAQIYDEIPQIFEEQKGVHDWKRFTDNEVA